MSEAYLNTPAKYPSTLAPFGHGKNTLPHLIPILSPLLDTLSLTHGKLLELASGEGLHLSALAQDFPAVSFWASEADDWGVERLKDNILGGGGRGKAEEVGKVKEVVRLDFGEVQDWKSVEDKLGKQDGVQEKFGGVFGVNFLHMIAFPQAVDALFAQLDRVLTTDGWLLIYGPFLADDGTFRTPGDSKFNAMISSRPSSIPLGLRSIPAINSIAQKHGYEVKLEIPMPVGNFCLLFRRI